MVSKTLTSSEWSNTTILDGDLLTANANAEKGLSVAENLKSTVPGLVAVLTPEELTDFGLQLAVAGVDRRTEGGFG